MSQPRVPRGTPKTGGQYAEDRRPEGGELTLEEAFSEIGFWSRRYANRFGVDSDDVMQDAMLTYSSLVKAPDKPVTKKQIISAAKYAAIAAIKGRSNHRDDAAMAAYYDETARQMNDLGRALTAAEEDAIAADIREKATKNPPTHGFHRRAFEDTFSMADVTNSDSDRWGQATLASRVEDAVRDSEVDIILDDFEAGSAGALVMETAPSNLAQARRMAWRALSDVNTPSPVENSVSRRSATEIREEISAAGGAVKCAKMYERGLLDSESIFTPFGKLDESGKDAVCRVLTRYPEYGDSLWLAVVSFAERRQ